jgi:hypothetical protein
MILNIINNMLVVLYVLSCLNVVRHLYKLFASWVSTEGDGEETIRYILEERKLLLAGLSIAYVISGFFTGITL